MQIGVPKEVVDQEYRVGLTPSSVRELIYQGHRVLVETNAGAGVGLSDKDYKLVGASIAKSPGRVFSDSELIVKVKEPQPNECKMLSLGQTIFTYLHLASDPKQANGLLDSGCAAIAYETVTDKNGGLPLLAPMSEVAGRMSVQIGAHYLEKAQGGSGVLIGGVPGVKAANVVIIGGGIAGTQAVRIALGMRAMVTVIDKNPDRLRELDEMFGDSLNTIQSTTDSIEHYVIDADLVIGAVLVTGSTAPKLVSRKMIRMMRPGSVVLDIAIDQGDVLRPVVPPLIPTRSIWSMVSYTTVLRICQDQLRGRRHLHSIMRPCHLQLYSLIKVPKRPVRIIHTSGVVLTSIQVK